MRIPPFGLLVLALGLASCAAALVSERSASRDDTAEVRRPTTLEARTAHYDEVQRADYCAKCHPDIVAEHRLNTHGRAFTDPEARLATARFSIEGCIACHTPRPIFETGIGMNPVKRLHHLEEGDDCLSCHAKANQDFSTFVGGPDCKTAFDARVGTVEACASCHRNHGTPYQWENAAHGKLAGNVCIDCHMPEVTRPVAIGSPARATRRHTFFASRSESQRRRAYAYDAKIEGNEVVVTIENVGAGHNFPTELKQRSVESLVVIRDVEGREIARSRQLHRDPYKRPYGLMLLVNTQIPSGEKRVHRVPIPLASGTVETALFYKLYYPIEDSHPDMSRTLETRIIPFFGITPSKKPIESEPELHAALPEALPPEVASPGNLADFAHPKIGKVEIDVPDGTHDGDIEKLIALFQFPVLEANRRAQDALASLGTKAVPALIEALGSWDNKTWKQAQTTLVRIGVAAKPAVIAALTHAKLYARLHACEILPRFELDASEKQSAVAALVAGLQSKEGLDRASCAAALGSMHVNEAAAKIRSLLQDIDFDVVAAASRALGVLDERAAIPELQRARARTNPSVETARDVAWGLAVLGDECGAAHLLDGLDHPDDLVRESIFEAFLDVTGRSMGYAPQLPEEQRLIALATLRNEWAKSGGASWLRKPRSLETPKALRIEVEKLVRDVGGNDIQPSTPEADAKLVARLIEIGAPATWQIIDGLKWPAGFADKRAALLRVLATKPDPDALAALIDAARDPVQAVALWAIAGLEALGDPNGLDAVRDYERRFEALAAQGRFPPTAGNVEDVRVSLARARLRLGDAAGARELMSSLFSRQPSARALAEQALHAAFDESSPNELLIAGEVRALLDALPEKRAEEIEALRQPWMPLIEKAEAATDAAKTRAEKLDALKIYDAAEEAAWRYQMLSTRAFEADFRRARQGADALAQSLYEDKTFRTSIPERDLLSPSERRGWSRSGALVTATIDPARIILEAGADAGGSFSFGLGGEGGISAPLERWRDYEISFEVDVLKKGLWILDRYDGARQTWQATTMSTEVQSVEGIVPVHIKEGDTYTVRHSVLGSQLVHEQHAVVGDETNSMTVNYPVEPRARKGGVVLELEAGAKVILRNVRVRVLRADGAQDVSK